MLLKCSCIIRSLWELAVGGFWDHRFVCFRNWKWEAGLMLPKVRTETARKSFYDIPNELKDINLVIIFKTRISEFYRSQAFLIIFKVGGCTGI